MSQRSGNCRAEKTEARFETWGCNGFYDPVLIGKDFRQNRQKRKTRLSYAFGDR